MNFAGQLPVMQSNENNDQFADRINTFLKTVISDVLIFSMEVPQLSDEVHKKVFSGDYQSPEGILTKLTKNIRGLSSEKKALCALSSKRNLVTEEKIS